MAKSYFELAQDAVDALGTGAARPLSREDRLQVASVRATLAIAEQLERLNNMIEILSDRTQFGGQF